MGGRSFWRQANVLRISLHRTVERKLVGLSVPPSRACCDPDQSGLRSVDQGAFTQVTPASQTPATSVPGSGKLIPQKNASPAKSALLEAVLS